MEIKSCKLLASVSTSYIIENRWSKMEAVSVDSALQSEDMDRSNSLVLELENLGINHSMSRVVVCLFHHPDSASLDMQKRCDLRQPEISQVVKNLEHLNILEKAKVKNTGRGRPSYRYSLSKSLPECIDTLLRLEQQKIDEKLQQMAEIRSLAEQISGKSE